MRDLRTIVATAASLAALTLPYCAGMAGTSASGYVLDARSGKGINNVEVRVRYAAASALRPAQRIELHTLRAASGADGRFEIDGWLGAPRGWPLAGRHREIVSAGRERYVPACPSRQARQAAARLGSDQHLVRFLLPADGASSPLAAGYPSCAESAPSGDGTH